jgi:cytochrome c-type biogenesis protein CcmH/NrfG
VTGYNIRARLGGASIPVSPMTSQQIVNLLKLVGTPRDSALLRFSLGSEYLKCAEFEPAIAHLNAAVEKDPGHSAAWKLLGNALAHHGRAEEALAAYRKGIEVAQRKGDRQAAKEMTVFSRRLEKVMASGKTTPERS